MSDTVLWVLIIFIVVAIVVMYGNHMRNVQMYKQHMEAGAKVNDEAMTLARRNEAIANEQLDVLKQIKTLLEDRKS